ncbi:hypothetical protein PF005_g21239 [Phytophthora fragariae]|uniref:Uncharacterized protein n=1 Tax=Phytophthora fragariae TaxID=53985 RepID=A0A6A3SE16_9STRA|nr:hypothetical protein PF003_g4125 [Phytophthora fragariae]KAE8941435.1 hypothetical protein PF009_g8758 [Phytophthora fragariae]KAE9085194.1 hypothetical protein PF007_g21229 [Phytophthora fragariae]KAE9115225.1 hypothetical protein PF006_g19337 [Phytophthora fragariae]KAE9185478.1 hypothetical protein PF005_g21239 [Phytophthora fragariae]
MRDADTAPDVRSEATLGFFTCHLSSAYRGQGQRYRIDVQFTPAPARNAMGFHVLVVRGLS